MEATGFATSGDAGTAFWSEALERDGYALVPLLTRSECFGLARIFDSLRAQTHIDAGFHVSMYSDDLSYRAQADAEIRAVFAPRVARYLSGHEALVGNFVVKSGESAAGFVPVHQDWTFVDERRSSSLSVWCPLSDVSVQQGALHVLSGSHRLPNLLRGPGVPLPCRSLEAAIRKRSTALSLPAGTAVIYHHRLVHWSPPNESGEARVAVNLLMAPVGARLLHVRRDQNRADDLLDVYAVERTYFLNHRPWEPPPDACRVARWKAAPEELTERALDELCGR